MDRFVQPVDDEFLCSICLGVFESPVHGPCGHTFCLKCIDNWIPVNVNACPLDKKPLFKKDLTPISIPFRNLLNRLEIKCEYESMGCDNICQMSRLSAHIKLCPFNPDGEMICQQGCGLTFPRRSQDDHKCIPALQEIIAKQRVEIADLQKKLGSNKRSYDQAFFSRYAYPGDRLSNLMEMESDLSMRRRANLRAEMIQERVRSSLSRQQQQSPADSLTRSRTPPPASSSSNSRIIAQLAAGPSSSAATATSSVASSSSDHRSLFLPASLASNRYSQLASRLAIRERDLPQLEVHVRRLTDDDLEAYGVSRDHLPLASSSSGPASSSTVERILSDSVRENVLLRRRLNSLNSNLDNMRSSMLPLSPPPVAASSQVTSQSSVGTSNQDLERNTQSSQLTSSSQSSSSSSSASSNSSSPERFNLLTAMLSNGSGCSSTRNG